MSIKELFNYDKSDNAAPAVAESDLYGNRRFDLYKLTDYHFTDGSYPTASQMKDLLTDVCIGLASYDNFKFHVDTSTLLPFIQDQEQDMKSNSLHPNVQHANVPTMTLLVDAKEGEERLFSRNYAAWALALFETAIGEHLSLHASRRGKQPLKELEPATFGFDNETTKIIQITDEKKQIEVKHSDGSEKTVSKSPYIITQKKTRPYSADRPVQSFTITIAVDTKDEHLETQSSSVIPLFTIQLIDKQIQHSGDGIINWDTESLAEWIPDARFAENIPDELPQELRVSPDLIRLLRKRCEGDIAYQDLLDPRTEREGRPYFYLELMMTAAKMVYYATQSQSPSSEKIPISREAQEQFRWLFDRLHVLFNEEFRTLEQSRATELYSPIEYLMYELLWKGENIWDELRDYTNYMTQSAQRNPFVFWQSVRALGLDKVLPSCQNMDIDYKAFVRAEAMRHRRENPHADGLEIFCNAFSQSVGLQKIDSENLSQYFERTISPIPSLLPYHEYKQGEEHMQSNEYYMKICLSLAAYAKERHSSIEKPNEPPFASFSSLIVDRNGEIISYAHNEPTNTSPDHWMHAEQIAIRRANRIKPGSTLYTPVELCWKCGPETREYPFARVVWSLNSKIGAETAFNMLSNDSPALQGSPIQRAPILVPGVLKEQATEFYKDTCGFGTGEDGLLLLNE